MPQRDRFAELFEVAPHEPSSQDPLNTGFDLVERLDLAMHLKVHGRSNR